MEFLFLTNLVPRSRINPFNNTQEQVRIPFCVLKCTHRLGYCIYKHHATITICMYLSYVSLCVFIIYICEHNTSKRTQSWHIHYLKSTSHVFLRTKLNTNAHAERSLQPLTRTKKIPACSERVKSAMRPSTILLRYEIIRRSWKTCCHKMPHQFTRNVCEWTVNRKVYKKTHVTEWEYDLEFL